MGEGIGCIQTHLDYLLKKFFNEDGICIPTRQIPFPNKILLNDLFNNMDDFYQLIYNDNENTNTRINKITDFASNIAKINGYIFDSEISKKNPKHKWIYTPLNNFRSYFLSVDTATPAFELCNERGLHQGEWSFSGEFHSTKPINREHNIKV